ncbi:MAG: hypothetical protein HY904_02395 [Deltaproteobacteria bacterium]|nr:hypothetical protein [Deltaproteobacteria bacterium]
MRALLRCLALVAAVPLLGAGACSENVKEAMDVDPNVGKAGPALATRFVSADVKREVTTPDGARWRLVVQDKVSAVGNSVDLWLSRGGAEGTWGAPVFAGAAPSCFGRPLNRTDPAQKGVLISTCYLSLFDVGAGWMTVKVYLGGTWQHTLRLPVDAAFSDQDLDGWSDALEALVGTHPQQPDSDGDGRPDPQDPNPLAAPLTNRATEKEDAKTVQFKALVAAAVEDLPGCQPDKPLLIIAPAAARQSFPIRPCLQVFLDDSWWVAKQRERLLPLDGKLPTGPAAVEEAAWAGGIARAKVEVKRVAPRDAEVHVINMAGRMVKHVSWESGRWVVDDRQFQAALEPVPEPPRR